MMDVTQRLLNSVKALSGALQEQEFNRKQAVRLRGLMDEAESAARGVETEKVLIEKALRLLVDVGDMVAEDSYRFVARSVNSLLEKMFTDCSRTVRITQRMVGKNPSLSVEIIADGVARDLSEASGHGIAQVVSIICVACLIILNGSRRIIVLDEVLSGIAEQNKAALSEALWAFTEIGFQFIVCEHAFVPDGAKVFHFVNINGVSKIDQVYIQGEQTD
jgi:hypothetical protein